MAEKRCQISVFLSMIFLCMASLTCGLLEAARTAGARCYLELAMNSSVDSLFSQYHRQMWEQYHIMELDSPDRSQLTKDAEKFAKPYLEVDNWYEYQPNEWINQEILGISDAGGKYLEEEIMDYMKYGIWNLDFEPEEMTHLWTQVTEAESVEKISEEYSLHTREAVRLENELEELGKSIKKQRSDWELGGRYLTGEEENGLEEQIQKLRRESRKIPGLVRKYDAAAEKLAEAMEKSRRRYEEEQANLSETIKISLEQELESYEEYTAQDGARRQEIDLLADQAWMNEAALDEVEAAIEAVRDAREEIEDSEEGDEEPDLDQLWEDVETSWGGFVPLQLSFQGGVQDKESEGLLERLKELAEGQILELVLSEGEVVSTVSMDSTLFPSRDRQDYPGNVPIVTSLLVNEYCGMFFDRYGFYVEREGASGEEVETGSDIAYELEYIICGEKTDKKNLEGTVTRLVAFRQGMNLIHVLTDTEKRQEASTLAQSIVGWTGVMPLVSVLSFLIMTLWAFGEALVDVKALLAGKAVPILKDRSQWQLSLSGLLDIVISGTLPDTPQSQEGFHYLSYLKLLLFVLKPEDRYYRMMDMMQYEIRTLQPDFLMKNGVYAAKIKVNLMGKHRFRFPGIEGSYPMECTVQHSY